MIPSVSIWQMVPKSREGLAVMAVRGRAGQVGAQILSKSPSFQSFPVVKGTEIFDLLTENSLLPRLTGYNSVL